MLRYTMQQQTVCAIIVTYNRKHLLLECLEGLRRQNRPVEAVYVIDNSSADGTPQELLEAGFISEHPDEDLQRPCELSSSVLSADSEKTIQLIYIRMPGNVGATGGFHEGMRRAYDRGFSWFWLMDDDVEPMPHALQKMLSYSNIGQCIQPTKRFLDGETFSDHAYFDLSFGKMAFLKESEFSRFNDFSCKNYGTFEGMLISRDVVKEIGLPDARFFFIGDDFIYGLLASLHTNNILIKESLFIKKLKRDAPKSLFGIKSVRLRNMEIYYYTRNMFLIYEYLKKLGTLSRFAYISHLWYVIKASAGIIFFEGSPYRLYLLYKGFIDGLLKRYNRLDCQYYP
ncbi:MAG: glycosyltransferase family 2 protein [Nitrospirae bacterium]|nr:glycosyltransferase family 2 protein [Nitrospirota bacterium]